MDKTKLIPIILLVVVLGVSFIAYSFYAEKQNLLKENKNIKEERAILVEENSSLKYKVNNSEREKRNIEQRLVAIQKAFSDIEKERNELQQKLAEVIKERDSLASKTTTTTDTENFNAEKLTVESGEERWADFIRETAALKAKLDLVKKDLLDTKMKVAELDKTNKEWSIKVDQLAKEKTRLEEEMNFKERILRNLSIDVVDERENKVMALDELKKLRNENLEQKKELVLANKEKMRLQELLKGTLEKKEGLENKIVDIENLLKEKSISFQELQENLNQAVSGGKKIAADGSASVELPPIIVKPTYGMKGLQGRIIAVNHQEQFVIIDLGETSGLRPGALFRIMRDGREIGSVEVIETRNEISAADIKEVIGGLTIQEGDVAVIR
ncbi:MAG: hypothetical protein KBB01_04010 [Candidatus Omnitrophica bacterium]|jgi:chromosome segregation ATPase|nr:hypothetical protein [Candidatus Omnitrophota bacterium]